MIQPGSSQIALLPSWLWHGDVEPHSTSSLAQGKGWFCSSRCMKTCETQTEGTKRHGVTHVVSMSQGRHRAQKSLGKGQCRQASMHTLLHWELHICLPNQQICSPGYSQAAAPARQGGLRVPHMPTGTTGTCT